MKTVLVESERRALRDVRRRARTKHRRQTERGCVSLTGKATYWQQSTYAPGIEPHAWPVTFSTLPRSRAMRPTFERLRSCIAVRNSSPCFFHQATVTASIGVILLRRTKLVP